MSRIKQLTETDVMTHNVVSFHQVVASVHSDHLTQPDRPPQYVSSVSAVRDT